MAVASLVVEAKEASAADDRVGLRCAFSLDRADQAPKAGLETRSLLKPEASKAPDLRSLLKRQ